MDYENTETPSMHRKFDSATLSHLVFPGESNPNFPWEKSQWDNTVVTKRSTLSYLPDLTYPTRLYPVLPYSILPYIILHCQAPFYFCPAIPRIPYLTLPCLTIGCTTTLPYPTLPAPPHPYPNLPFSPPFLPNLCVLVLM